MKDKIIYKEFVGSVRYSDEDHKKQSKNKFEYLGRTFFNSADVGNYHAGYTGKFTYKGNGMPTSLLLYGAGGAETFKTISQGQIIKSMLQILEMNYKIPPFGYNPTDYYWNLRGMIDAEKYKKAIKNSILY